MTKVATRARTRATCEAARTLGLGLCLAIMCSASACDQAPIVSAPPLKRCHLNSAEEGESCVPVPPPPLKSAVFAFTPPPPEALPLDEAPLDGQGNPEGVDYDLAQDGEFEGHHVGIINLITREVNPRKAIAALEKKGFKVSYWRRPPPLSELEAFDSPQSQLWLISNKYGRLKPKHIDFITSFSKAGRGLYLMGDNAPYYRDVNRLARALLGEAKLRGDIPGRRVLRERSEGGPGFIRHPITHGLLKLYEGASISRVKPLDAMVPIVWSSGGGVVMAVYTNGQQRIILDGGFTRLMPRFWRKAGTARLVTNAAAWLAGKDE